MDTCILNLALDVDEWSASRTEHFVPGTHWLGNWVSFTRRTVCPRDTLVRKLCELHAPYALPPVLGELHCRCEFYL
jgi:hypothetical protein